MKGAISIKCRELQERLGIDPGRDAHLKVKKKLTKLGVTIFDKEFISETEFEEVTLSRVRQFRYQGYTPKLKKTELL